MLPTVSITSASNKRGFLKLIALSGISFFSGAAAAAQPVSLSAPRTLSFNVLHTRERLVVTYWEKGAYVPESLDRIDYLLRDHRSNEAMVMDIKLLDSLWLISETLRRSVTGAVQSGVDPDAQYSGTIEVISGYRSPATNAMLRLSSSGVARRSYHMSGRAIDFRIAGVSLERLRQVALDLALGGVGYYRASDFIHIDTGPVRNW